MEYEQTFINHSLFSFFYLISFLIVSIWDYKDKTTLEIYISTHCY